MRTKREERREQEKQTRVAQHSSFGHGYPLGRMLSTKEQRKVSVSVSIIERNGFVVSRIRQDTMFVETVCMETERRRTDDCD